MLVKVFWKLLETADYKSSINLIFKNRLGYPVGNIKNKIELNYKPGLSEICYQECM